MKFIFKNFIHLLKGFTTSSILNILGMAAALSVFIIISMQLYYNFTYNKNLENSSHIYNFRRYYPSDDFSVWTISVPVAENMVKDFSEIKNYCVIQKQDNASFDVGNGDKNISSYTASLIVANAGFKSIFNPQILLGDASLVFEDTDKAMISEKTAKDIFGGENPVGKVIKRRYSQQSYTIAAVYKDFPENSSLTNGIYTKLTTYSHNNWGYDGYFELIPGAYKSLSEKLNGAGFRGEETLKQQDLDPSIREDYVLTPLSEVFMEKNPQMKTISYTLLIIGILILMIAYTNFINFSMAIIPSRIKNFNIHKILGVNRLILKFSVITEGIFITIIAFLLAVFFIYFFSTTALTSFFAADLTINENKGLIMAVFFAAVALSALLCIYPAQYAASIKESSILNGSFTLSSRGSKLRNILITFQYIIAILLICVSGFIKLQQDYMKNYSIGLEKENIVYLPVAGLKTDIKTFGDELKSNPEIIDYTASGFIPGRIYMSWNRNFEDKFLQNVYAWPVTSNFLDFFGIDVIAGNNFTKTDTVGLEQIIFNRKFLEKYDLDESIIGKSFPMFNEGTIMGIASDVNFSSLRSPIDPMAFVIVNDQKDWINYIFVKISDKNISGTISYIESTWKKYNDDDFHMSFLNTAIGELYKQEENQSQIIAVFGLITIIIAVMGVYGLIVFNTRYKEKEISVRKINGATEKQIVYMLNKSLLWLLLIACIIAVPVAFYLIEKWLESYAYKAPVPWWLFAGAGLVVLVITVITVSWQSWKAATANPVESLKTE